MKIGIFAALVVVLAAIYGTVVGWVMCFHASIILGIISLFVQGSGLLEWCIYEISGYDIASHLAQALGLQ